MKKFAQLKMAAAALAVGAAASLVPQAPAMAQAKEQFFPVLMHLTAYRLQTAMWTTSR
jgi:hypothetical protein